MNSREIKEVLKGQPVLEGAGVHVKRLFGYEEVPKLDPFLLFDDFSSDDPSKYHKGFPWHPHRGIDTITYMLEGTVEHSDSMGNKGVIKSGDTQWMTAGSGIIHQEMPKGNIKGQVQGFQLWANLPAEHKMIAPKYRGITDSEIPVIKKNNGDSIKIICGEFDGVKSPVSEVKIEPEYLDVKLVAGSKFEQVIKNGHTVFAYIIDGNGVFSKENGALYQNGDLILFNRKGAVNVKAGIKGVRFLLISGKPLNEPIAWRGPIVMNTQDELRLAFAEIADNTFLKSNNYK